MPFSMQVASAESKSSTGFIASCRPARSVSRTTLCLAGHGKAAVAVGPARADAVVGYSSLPISGALSTLPVATSFSSITKAGVVITP